MEHPAYGGPPKAQVSCNGHLTQSLGGEFDDAGRLLDSGRGPPPGPGPARMGDPRFHPLAEDLPFKLSKNGQEPCQGPSRRGGEIDRFRHGDKADPEPAQFLEGADEIREGSAPAIETPHQDDIECSLAGGAEQPLALRPRLHPRAHVSYLGDTGPLPVHDIRLHGVQL